MNNQKITVNYFGLEQVAKGHVQMEMLKDLLNDNETWEFNAYMKAPSKSSNYVNSFINLINRLEYHGLNVKIQMGKLGGYWTARAILD